MQDQKSQSFGNAFLNKGYEHNFLKKISVIETLISKQGPIKIKIRKYTYTLFFIQNFKL